MDSFWYSLLIGLFSGVISGTITGLWFLRYSEFVECKNILRHQIDITHLYVVQLKHQNYNQKLMELHNIVLTIKDRIYQAGHSKASIALGNIQTEILSLKNLISSSSIPRLQISDYFIAWRKDVDNLSVSWCALMIHPMAEENIKTAKGATYGIIQRIKRYMAKKNSLK